MKNWLIQLIKKNDFEPGLLGIFLNPTYLTRKDLDKHITSLGINLSGKLLDIGCGNKPYKNKFSSVTEYIGIEFDTEQNRKNKDIDVFYRSGSLPFEDGTFDSALSTQVLEHVDNPPLYIKEAGRILKTGGRLLLTVPFVWPEHEQPADYTRYSSFGIKKLIENEGFRVITEEKSLTGLVGYIQMIICYIRHLLRRRYYWLKLLCYVLFISPLTILAIILSKIAPRYEDFYINNIILAEKTK